MQGPRRIEACYLSGQRGKIRACDVRRVGDDRVEPPGQGCRPITDAEMRPIGKAEGSRITNRCPDRALGDVDAKPVGPSIFTEKGEQEAAGPGT